MPSTPLIHTPWEKSPALGEQERVLTFIPGTQAQRRVPDERSAGVGAFEEAILSYKKTDNLPLFNIGEPPYKKPELPNPLGDPFTRASSKPAIIVYPMNPEVPVPLPGTKEFRFEMSVDRLQEIVELELRGLNPRRMPDPEHELVRYEFLAKQARMLDGIVDRIVAEYHGTPYKRS